MIRMISGRTMIGLGGNHSVHLIREIMVPDDGSLRDTLLPKLMRGEVRVSEL